MMHHFVRIRMADNMFRGAEVLIVQEIPDKPRRYGRVEFIEVDDLGLHAPDDCVMDLSRQAIQALMDDMWRSGVRPSDEWDPQGRVSAMKEHIADLRLSHETLVKLAGRER